MKALFKRAAALLLMCVMVFAIPAGAGSVRADWTDETDEDGFKVVSGTYHGPELFYDVYLLANINFDDYSLEPIPPYGYADGVDWESFSQWTTQQTKANTQAIAENVFDSGSPAGDGRGRIGESLSLEPGVYLVIIHPEGEISEFVTEWNDKKVTFVYDESDNSIYYFSPMLVTVFQDESMNPTLKYDHEYPGNRKITAIRKVDADTGELLSGAEFKLYAVDGNKEEQPMTVFLEGTNGLVYLYPRDEVYVTQDGYALMYNMIENQLYALVETKTPDGYNQLAEPIFFYAYDSDEQYDNKKVTVVSNGKQYYTQVMYMKDGDLIVENSRGAVLPETGGIGTAIFTLVGVVVIVGSLTVLSVKKKRKPKKA